MAGCITEDYKEMFANLLTQDMAKELLIGFVRAIPLCEVTAPRLAPGQATEAHKRRVPAVWGIEPVYVDEQGKKQTFSSPSALVKHLGFPMSGIQCDAEGKQCKAMSAIEILQIKGYVVSGNGEIKKASEGGHKLTVYHPKSVPKEK